MDAKKFGIFIADIRKKENMTQKDLAEKLQVTDKAVSRWERGLGFPDINTLEPLADALHLSVLELMKSEKIEEITVTCDEAAEAIRSTFDIAKEQRARERRNLMKILAVIASVLAVVVVLDSVGTDVFILLVALVYLPVLGLTAGIVMLVYAGIRWKRKLSCRQSVIAGVLLILIPAVIMGVFMICGLLGLGPVPT